MLRVLPKTYTTSAYTLLATLMHKNFAQPPKNTIPMLTTLEALGKTTPNKHETSYGVHCRNLSITGLDLKYDIDRTFADDLHERLRSHFLFLNSILSTHLDTLIRDLKRTKADVHTWFKAANIKKRSKIITANVHPPPPPPYIHVPFEVLCVIINDALCEPPKATIHSATRATLAAARVTEVMGEEAGLRVWDEAPSGTWQKTILPPEGEVFRTNCLPTYHPHGPLWGIEFLVVPAPKRLENAPKWARITVMDSWLQAAGAPKDCEQADAEK